MFATTATILTLLNQITMANSPQPTNSKEEPGEVLSDSDDEQKKVIFVGNLAQDVTEELLYELFLQVCFHHFSLQEATLLINDVISGRSN